MEKEIIIDNQKLYLNKDILLKRKEKYYEEPGCKVQISHIKELLLQKYQTDDLTQILSKHNKEEIEEYLNNELEIVP